MVTAIKFNSNAFVRLVFHFHLAHNTNSFVFVCSCLIFYFNYMPIRCTIFDLVAILSAANIFIIFILFFSASVVTFENGRAI